MSHCQLKPSVVLIADAKNNLSISGWQDAAEGILTTDTRAKGASSQFDIQGSTVTITGICKGSGMIKPNMATMLGFVATDASIDEELLHAALRKANGKSFNRVTVDGDTSTNDAVVLVATGASGIEIDETNFDQFLDSANRYFCAVSSIYSARRRGCE